MLPRVTVTPLQKKSINSSITCHSQRKSKDPFPSSRLPPFYNSGNFNWTLSFYPLNRLHDDVHRPPCFVFSFTKSTKTNFCCWGYRWNLRDSSNSCDGAVTLRWYEVYQSRIFN